jgi:hypothetical protein
MPCQGLSNSTHLASAPSNHTGPFRRRSPRHSMQPKVSIIFDIEYHVKNFLDMVILISDIWT